jgi:hypothetical protein
MRHPSFLAMAIAFTCCIALAKGLQQKGLAQQKHVQSAQALEDAERTLVPLSAQDGSPAAGSRGTPWHLRFQN